MPLGLGLDQIGDKSMGETIKKEYTGSSTSYYKLFITTPASSSHTYTAECLDIIEELNMNFAEGEAFKALWRRAAARKFGAKKRGYDTTGLYDAEKAEFYSHRLVVQSQLRKEPT